MSAADDFDFEDLYDPDVIAALDSWRADEPDVDGPPLLPSRVSRWGRSAALGMGFLRRSPNVLFDWMMDQAGPKALTTEF